MCANQERACRQRATAVHGRAPVEQAAHALLHLAAAGALLGAHCGRHIRPACRAAYDNNRMTVRLCGIVSGSAVSSLVIKFTKKDATKHVPA